MSLTFRPYREPEDRGEAGDVFSVVYRNSEPWPDDRPIQGPDESTYLAESEGRTVACWLVRHMTATLAPGSSVRCGGIAGVAVRPEARSGGVGSGLMRWALRRMREDGYPITSLYAFRESFYRRLGYEVCGERFKIQCPQHRLPSTRPAVATEICGEDAWKTIEPIYRAFASRYSGMNERTESQWITATRGMRNVSRVYAIGSPAEAYCVVHVQNGFWEEQHVSEAAWSTPEGYRALLGFFGGLAANKSALTWYEPGDSPFLASYTDQGVKASIERPVMYRVLDVPATLSALRPLGSGVVTLEVQDEELPENRGPWRIAFGRDGVEATPTDSADLAMDIRCLTQAVLGQPSFGSLLSQGRIESRTSDASASAQALFGSRYAYCMDFF